MLQEINAQSSLPTDWTNIKIILAREINTGIETQQSINYLTWKKKYSYKVYKYIPFVLKKVKCESFHLTSFPTTLPFPMGILAKQINILLHIFYVFIHVHICKYTYGFCCTEQLTFLSIYLEPKTDLFFYIYSLSIFRIIFCCG